MHDRNELCFPLKKIWFLTVGWFIQCPTINWRESLAQASSVPSYTNKIANSWLLNVFFKKIPKVTFTSALIFICLLCEPRLKSSLNWLMLLSLDPLFRTFWHTEQKYNVISQERCFSRFHLKSDYVFHMWFYTATHFKIILYLCKINVS